MTSSDAQSAPMPPDPHTRVVLTIGIALAPAAFSFGFASFLDLKDLLYGLLTVLLAGIALIQRQAPLSLRGPFAPLWMLLAATAIIHGLLGVAEVPAYTAEELLRFTILLTLATITYQFMKQSPKHREAILSALVASTLIVAAIALLQRLGWTPSLFPRFPDYPQPIYSVFGNQDLLGGYMAIGVALTTARSLASPKHLSRAIPALTLLVAVLALSGSRSAWLAAAVGILSLAPRMGAQRRLALGLAVATTATIGAVALVSPESTVDRFRSTFAEDDTGFRARLWIWDGAIRMAGEYPFFGAGPGNFKYWSPTFQGEALHAEGGRDHYHNEIHTLHAHSDPLEVLAELGLLGPLFIVPFLWGLRRGRGEEWAGLAAFATFGLMNTTLHSPPHILAALILCAALATGSAAPPPHTEPSTEARLSVRNTVTAVACLGLLAFFIFARAIPSHRLALARTAYERDPANAIEAYRRAAAYPWPRYDAQEEYATLLVNSGDMEQASPWTETALRGSDTGRIHYLRARIHEGDARYEEAAIAYRECAYRWPSYRPAWEGLIAMSRSDAREVIIGEASGWLGEAVTLGAPPHRPNESFTAPGRTRKESGSP